MRQRRLGIFWIVLFLLALLAIALPITLFGAPKTLRTWTGNVDSTWNNPANWDSGVPGAGDDCFVPASASFWPVLVATQTCSGALSVAKDAQVITGDQGVGDDYSGQLISIDGTWSVNNNFDMHGAASDLRINQGALIVLSNASLGNADATGPNALKLSGTLLPLGTSRIYHGTSLNVNSGGTVMIPSGSALNVNDGGTVTNSGTIVQSANVNNSSFDFATLKDETTGAIKYRGITVSSSSNLGTVSVQLGGNQTCTGGDFAKTVKRCYSISPVYPQSSMLTFYYESGEANGNLAPNVYQYDGTGWTALNVYQRDLFSDPRSITVNNVPLSPTAILFALADAVPGPVAFGNKAYLPIISNGFPQLPTRTPTRTRIPAGNATATFTPISTMTVTPTPTVSPTPSITPTPSQSPTPTNTATPTNTPTNTPVPTPPSEQGFWVNSPYGIVSQVDQVSQVDHLFISNHDQNTVTVWNEGTQQVTKVIPVGLQPWGVTSGGIHGYVYVANSGSNTVSVIDSTSLNRLFDVDLSQCSGKPTNFAVDYLNGLLFVSMNGSVGHVAKLNVDNASYLGCITTGYPNTFGLSWDYYWKQLYITNLGANHLVVYNTAPGSEGIVKDLTLDGRPYSVQVEDQTGWVYFMVARNSPSYDAPDTLEAYDGNDLTSNNIVVVATIGNTGDGGGIVVTQANRNFYIAATASDQLWIVDAYGHKRSISLPNPYSVAENPSRGLVYVGSRSTGWISILANDLNP